MDGIFISYRRDDSAGYAGRLYDRLAGHFGAERVFMDVEGIEPGADFVEAIEAAVSSCRVLIVIIGNEWTQTTDAAGRRRLDDPNDFIRLETGAALRRGIRVVPVLVEGAVMPRVEELPDDIKTLARRQAIEISHKQWDASTGELIRTLESLLAKTTAGATTTTTAGTGIPATDATSSTTASADVGTPAVATPQLPPPEAVPRAAGRRRLWPLPAAALLAALAGAGLWFLLGKQPDAGPPTSTGPALLAGARPEAAPDAKPPPLPESKSRAAVPTPAVVEEAPRATAEPAPVPPAEPTRAPPIIRSFKAESGSAGVRLCYRVSGADSLILSPRPGELDKTDRDCVAVDVVGPTTFTLTARNAGKVVRKELAVAPRPRSTADTATAPVDPVPAAGSVAVASSRTASGLPLKGERWVYRSSGKWPTSPKRQFEIVVRAMADGTVTDALRIIGAGSSNSGEERRSRGQQPDFVAWSDIGIEFNPYFGAFLDLERQDSLSGLPTPDLGPQWRQWFSTLKVVGQESVSVPAGTFSAYKVEVWSSRHATGNATEAALEPVRIHYLVWYAGAAKRYVKMQRRVISAASVEGEKDVFELLEHTLP